MTASPQNARQSLRPPSTGPRPGGVLFLVHRLNLTGVSHHTMALGAGLRRRGWRVGVVARDLQPGTPLGREWFELAGIATFPCPFPGYGLTPDNVAAAARTVASLDRIARDFRATVLHVHAPTLCPYAGLVGWARGVPVVSTLHIEGLGPNKVRLARAGTSVFRRAFGDYTIGISREMAVLACGLGIPHERIRVIPHGVDAARFRPPTPAERADARAALGVPPGVRVVCLVARLDAVKGHDVLIRALGELRARGRDVVGLCAGPGSEDDRRRITAGAVDAGVADLVRLPGYCDSRQVMWASDVAVLLSPVEGFGLAIAEAMLCGLPAVRTPSAGAADQIVDGNTGFLVPFGDHHALAERLARLFDDPTLRRRMGDAASTHAGSRFTEEAMVDQTERAYADAVRGYRRRVVPMT